jgi:large subunit ribosomal protein L2
MALKEYKSITPGLRGKKTVDYSELTGQTLVKTLTKFKKSKAGRNNTGKITVRRRGGGVKKKYRIIDFLRSKEGVSGEIISVEYDPNRTAWISLVKYQDGEKAYIISPEGVKVGDVIDAGKNAEIKKGNSLKLKDIPTGLEIHNIETKIGKGSSLVRSAGCVAVLLAKSGNYVTVKLPSGELRMIHADCKATIGRIGNSDKRNIVIAKAGANRKKGRRPKVRGSVMNACDHPHGGGEGKAPIGKAGPYSKWGKPVGGVKTRKRINKYVVKRRK